MILKHQGNEIARRYLSEPLRLEGRVSVLDPSGERRTPRMPFISLDITGLE
jgi:hypothetical protein